MRSSSGGFADGSDAVTYSRQQKMMIVSDNKVKYLT